MRRLSPLCYLPFVILGPEAGATSILAEAPSQTERTLLAESFATQKLWIWQRRLQLEDWKISVKMAHLLELRPKTVGNIHWDSKTKTACISVLDPEDYKLPLSEILQDIEFTVVHELIHLSLSALPRSEASKLAEERAANLLAQALISLDRKAVSQKGSDLALRPGFSPEPQTEMDAGTAP